LVAFGAAKKPLFDVVNAAHFKEKVPSRPVVADAPFNVTTTPSIGLSLLLMSIIFPVNVTRRVSVPPLSLDEPPHPVMAIATADKAQQPSMARLVHVFVVAATALAVSTFIRYLRTSAYSCVHTQTDNRPTV
jgi:hypothetical protein